MQIPKRTHRGTLAICYSSRAAAQRTRRPLGGIDEFDRAKQLGCGAVFRRPATCGGANLPQQTDRPDRAVRRRRHHRLGVAADRAAHERQLGPARHRSQPAGRRQHDRHQHRRQGRGRWSYAAGHHHRLRNQRQPAEDAIRPDQGFRADHRADFDPDHAGGAPVAAGEKRQGADRVFQGAAGRRRLRLVRRRHVHPSGG